MTGLLESAEAVTPPSPVAPRRARWILAVLPWVLPVAALVASLLLTGTPAGAIAAYGAYLALAVALPGTLVHRALRGSRGNLPEDLGYGAATCLLLQLIAWAVTAATGLQSLLRWWPALVVVAFLAVPRLRRHWRVAEPRPLPLRWSWMVAAVLLGVVSWTAQYWWQTPLPPADTAYYPDLMYHLALVHEMMRSIPFQVPQLAGDMLRYHYLSDADMATASMITGIPPATVLLRLWLVPIVTIAVLVVAALTRELSGRWWAGPLAGAAAFLGLPLVLGAPISPSGGFSLSYASPSQTYATPLLALLVAIAVDVVRGRPLTPPAPRTPFRDLGVVVGVKVGEAVERATTTPRSRGGVRPGRAGWAWILVPPLALACAGAKSSALPPFAAGLLLAGVVAAIVSRRVPWRVLALLGVTAAAMAVGVRLFAGGGAGTLALQPLSLLRWTAPYRETLDISDNLDRGGFLPPGLAGATAAGRWFVAWVVGWWLLMQAPRLIGLAALGGRRTRSDPAAWLLGGMIVAGAGAAWLFWHPAASQLYFFLGAVPFGAMLTVWLLAAHARRWPMLLGLLAGAVWAIAAPRVSRPSEHSVAAWAWVLTVPVLWTAAAAAIAAAITVLAARRVGARVRQAVGVVLLAAVVGAGLATGLPSVAQGAWSLAFRSAPGPPPTERLVTAEEMRAALWLDAHAGGDDLVATNVHCQPIARKKPCDARAFWVAGLGGRRTLIESWGYSDQAVAENGHGGLRFVLQPAPYPQRYELNERVFASADPADIAKLRRTYGVRWLFADSRAGPVSPRLARLAAVRYTAGPATVYELR